MALTADCRSIELKIWGVGVVTVSSSASRAATTPPTRFVSCHRPSPSGARPASIVAFKTGRTKCSAVAATTSQEPVAIPLDQPKQRRRPKKNNPTKAQTNKQQRNNELNYSEVAAALENIYKLSPAAGVADAEGFDRKRRKDLGGGENIDNINVVRNRKRRARRLNLDMRVERKRRGREGEIRGGFSEKVEEEEEDVERLVREYSVSTTDLVSLDWRKMKILPVLSSSEQARLFRLIQPMKAIFEVKENLHNDLNKEPTEGELAAAVNMTVPQLRRHIEVGQAARNKLIKVRQEIQKAKLELMCELQRLPTEEEIISRVGISPERYRDVMKASKSVYSLNSGHVVTQEEFINAITTLMVLEVTSIDSQLFFDLLLMMRAGLCLPSNEM